MPEKQKCVFEMEKIRLIESFLSRHVTVNTTLERPQHALSRPSRTHGTHGCPIHHLCFLELQSLKKLRRWPSKTFGSRRTLHYKILLGHSTERRNVLTVHIKNLITREGTWLATSMTATYTVT